jgi:hypothetical protein
MCCAKLSSVINLDLFWKQVFSFSKIEGLANQIPVANVRKLFMALSHRFYQ